MTGKERRGGRRLARRIVSALAVVMALPFVLTVLYAAVPPPVSMLMILNALGGRGIEKDWVRLDDIAPALPRAVLASEDARFCEHNGVDWRAVRTVVEDALDNPGEAPRGASTIAMQTAKNLYLWPGRSYLRKALEIPLAYWIDLVWPKRRQIEIYLNIAEWGPGLYGAQAAARHHFGKPASALTRREAALLAAVLPAPLERNAGRPGPVTRRIASRIVRRMAGMDPYLACLSP
ncbi:monofunctional biosynthetic peptidoglycan transglycosylase [Kaustia mangrovi]|uniref:Biosynthetic peptidoglycan transglycosylase n=1 Tax=Kaustia mangrovi TaxID=2593653 RepID=A0A7S8C4G4_9HYPH|nr:monofunctional biosynthetic peptidoglycan transglycosylase [Kaustia mangrovi]QPC43147.1 monofunctional biosynthetic peptidoglycan transglycosylase [Kaustia mangrovi]